MKNTPIPTVEPYVCDYENDGRRITAPGKFEGQPVFAPDFWDTALEGFADGDNGRTYSFRIRPEDFAKHPTLKAWIGRRRVLRLREDDSGFVRCF